jgi:glycosyltransferase involved in cell wall biosynthesis
VRLTFVINSLAAGGAQRVVIDLMAQLTARGHEVTLVTYSRKERDHFSVPAGVDRIQLNLLWNSRNLLHGLQSNLVRLRLLRTTLLQSRPDVVVSFIDLTNIMTLVSMIGTGVPVVISERIHPKFYEIGRQWRFARQLTYFMCAALVVQTRDIAQWARRVVPRARIRVIPNAAPASRSSATCPPREKVVLAVGRLNVQKGFDLLLEAFAESGVWRDDWRLVIVGEGPERNALEKIAEDLRIASHVELPGEQSSADDWYQRCGIFVLSSRYEGFPNVLLEAMANGCPAIAFDCPSGPRDILDPSGDGLLLPAEDGTALAAAIARLCTDSALRNKLGDAARSVQKRFSQDSIVACWEQLFAEFASRRQPN